MLAEEEGVMLIDRDWKDLIRTSAKMNENNGVVASNGVIHDKITSTLKAMCNWNAEIPYKLMTLSVLS